MLPKKRLARYTIIVLVGLLIATFVYHAFGIRAIYLTIRAGQGKSAIPALVDALDDSSEVMRKVTVSALARFGLDALQPLLSALKDADPRRREGAAICLGRMPLMHPELLPMLKDQAQGPLLDALKDQDVRVQVQAANSLWRITGQSDQAMPTFLALCGKAHTISVRYHAIGGLERIGPQAKEAVPTLLELLSDEHEYVRVWASTALEAIDATAAREAKNGRGPRRKLDPP